MHRGRKITGGRYIKSRKKKLFEITGQKKNVRLGEDKRKIKIVRGGNVKTFLLRAKTVNIQTKGRAKKAEIKNVIETPSNRFLARQNIITKGAILDTEMGLVRVTSRPGQDGTVNGILVS